MLHHIGPHGGASGWVKRQKEQVEMGKILIVISKKWVRQDQRFRIG